MARTPVDADVSFFGGEAKVRWFIDGKKYALRMSREDFDSLTTNEGEVIRKVTT